MTRLKLAALQTCHEGQFVVKSSPDAIEIKVFDPSRTDANLGSWTEYAQKEAARIATEGDLMILLPFDIRENYGVKVASQIDGKRDNTLALLRSRERFKILQYL